MKLKRFFSPVMLMAVAIAGIFASCSNEAASIEDKLTKYVSDDTDVIVTINVDRALAAGEVTKNEDGVLELPDYLNDAVKDALSKKDRKFLDAALEFKGLDWTNTVIAAKMKTKDDYVNLRNMLIIFSISDADEFIQSIEDYPKSKFSLDEEGEDGFTVVSNKDAAILINGNVGFIAFDNDGPCKATKSASIIKEWEDAAGEKQLAQWKVEQLKAQKIGNVLINCKFIAKLVEKEMDSARERKMAEAFQLDKLEDICYLMNFDIEGATTSAEAKLLDKDGKEFVHPAPKLGKIDASLLAYASSNDLFAGALATGDLTQLINTYVDAGMISNADAAEAKKMVKNLNNATIFVSGGPADGVRSFSKPNFGNWHLVAAVKFENSNNAKNFIDLLSAQLGNQLNVDENGNMSLSIPTDYSYQYNPYTYEYESVPISYQTIYIKHSGNELAISNTSITKANSSRFNAKDFAGKTFAFGAVVAKENPLLTQFNVPFGAKVQASASVSSAAASISLTGTKDNFIPAIFKLAYSNMPRGGNDYDDSYVADSVVAYDYDYDYVEPAVEEAVAYDYGYDSVAVAK